MTLGCLPNYLEQCQRPKYEGVEEYRAAGDRLGRQDQDHRPSAGAGEEVAGGGKEEEENIFCKMICQSYN